LPVLRKSFLVAKGTEATVDSVDIVLFLVLWFSFPRCGMISLRKEPPQVTPILFQAFQVKVQLNP
jgi:hypothetical protein